MDDSTLLNTQLKDYLNKLALEVLGASYFRREANWKYFADKTNGTDRYFYTTEKVIHKGRPRYVAGIYRYLKTKDVYKLVKQVGFAKKKRAIKWALEAYRKKI